VRSLADAVTGAGVGGAAGARAPLDETAPAGPVAGALPAGGRRRTIAGVPDSPPTARRRGVALLLSCHPAPALAVTVIATLLAVAAGASAGTVALIALAFGAGQLSIGWSNDWVDAARDVAVGRTDKPVATGSVTRTAVGTAAVLAAAAAVPLSLALGVAAGLAQLVGVASGWAYNLGLKSTVWSWLPYAVTFGLLPAVVTLALPGSPLPPPWAVAAGALLGVGAHLVNVLPDLEDDAATGVRGLPHRMGARASQLGAAAVLLAAAASLLLGPHQGSGGWRWLVLVVNAVLAAVVAVGGGRTPFRVAMLMALIDVVLLTTSGQASA
jgi:4-hydroxybenzoate polyprenyltransferase